MDEKTKVCGLVASPIERSMSPMMHNLFAQRAGVNLAYVSLKAGEGRVEDVVKRAYALSMLRMNVTVPHKQRVMKFLSELDRNARVVRAVNTLVGTAAGYKGYNTNGAGLKQALAQAGIRAEGEHCLLTGAEDTARAAAYVLAKDGTIDVHILNRSKTKARELVSCINTSTGNGLAEVLLLKGYRKLPAREGGHLAVQSISVDMHPHVESVVIDDPRFYEMIHAGMDVVHTPARTRFMKMTQEVGEGTMNGLDAPLYQGVIAYELWNLQMKVDGGTIKTAEQMIEDYLVRKRVREGQGENLIFTGFIGAGRTSMGEHFAARYRIPMIDTDKKVETTTGMAISGVFVIWEGEAFRHLETGVLEKLLRRSGRPATSMDDGLSLRAGSGTLLKQLETMIYLDILLKTVVGRIGADMSSHPMLHGSDVAGRIIGLLGSKKPYYLEASHIIVDVSGRDADDIVEEIHHRAVDKTY